jgi:hypothetical protein
MQIAINIDDNLYTRLFDNGDIDAVDMLKACAAIRKGTPLTSEILADMLMEERIRGELKQDISYSKDIIDDVKCRLTVSIRDNRPCYCSAELRGGMERK